jgi:hypothetical protein
MAEERVDRARKMVRRINLISRRKGEVIRVRVSCVVGGSDQRNELQQRSSIDLHAARRTPLLPAFRRAIFPDSASSPQMQVYTVLLHSASDSEHKC